MNKKINLKNAEKSLDFLIKEFNHFKHLKPRFIDLSKYSISCIEPKVNRENFHLATFVNKKHLIWLGI